MQPNIVVIVSDDQGYGDLGCLGADYMKTPHLDGLVESGALLKTFYSNSPVCSPSRASLLTGRYPTKAGVRSIIEHHRWAPGLSSDVPSVPSVLRANGYHTGLVGKWHLGTAEGCRPGDHGFEEFFGPMSGTVDYFSHINYSMNNRQVKIRGEEVHGTPLHDLWENDREVWANGHYMTEVIGQRAVNFIHRKADSERPFALVVTFTAPHFPLHAPKKYVDRFPGLSAEKRIIAAMISAMDDQIGDIVAALDDRGIRENTLIWFLSDNGPSREIRNWLDGRQDPFYGGSTGELKGHKFSLFEGGIRVPSIVSWPAAISAGRVVEEPIVAMDIFPTIAAAVGLDVEAIGPMDGMDLLPALAGDGTGQSGPLHDAIYWEQGDQTAIRRGDWKLVLNGRIVEHEGPVAPVFLSNLHGNPEESRNLANEHPDLARQLTEDALAWRADTDETWTTVWLPRLGTDTTATRPAFVR